MPKILLVALILLSQWCGAGLAQTYGSGSGFFVTTDGYFVTNYHVVESAKSIAIRTVGGTQFPAQVVRVDVSNDIAILKAEGAFRALPVGGSQNVRRGDRVFTMGFPNIDVQGVEPKYTEGVVSSLTGVGDAPTDFQITVALQPGNSGGPLVSSMGNVVGIVQAKLSALGMIKRGGSLPESVNYAVKSNYLLELISTLPNVKRGMLAARTKPSPTMSNLAELAGVAIGLVVVTREAEQRTVKQQAPSAPEAPPISQLSSGEMYQRGVAAVRAGREFEALEWYRKAAEQGDARAQISLGRAYLQGRAGLAKDDAQAVEWFRKAALQGHAIGQAGLGAGYLEGRGVPQDDVQAAEWLGKAAQQGQAIGQAGLGLMYEQGRGGLPKDDAQAIEWYRKAAVQGNGPARDALKRLGVGE